MRPGPIAAAALVALALGLAGLVSACPEEGSPPDPASAGPRRGELTIFHTNDWHGYALAERPPRRPRGGPRPARGGLAAAAAALAKLRAEVGADRVLALDAGDLLTGHPAAALAEDGVVGATFVRAWCAVGYDAWVPGNHDFDAGRTNAEALVRLAARTPSPTAAAAALVANLHRADDSKPVLAAEPYRIFERGGLKVGVIGLIPGDLARLASAETMAGIRASPLAEAARPLARRLEKECDLVVALTHAGVDADRQLARDVPEIDVIVGGHSHTRLRKPAVEGTTIIVQAGAHGREFGRLDLTVEGGKVVRHEGRLATMFAEGVTAPAAMREPLARIEAYMAELERDVIGEATHELRRGNYYGETPIGSFVADAVRAAAEADVAFMNSGGIRAEIPKGRFTRAGLLKVLPNDNRLAVFEATGAEVEAILLHNARAAATRDHGVLQVSGVRYRWRKVESGAADGKPGARLLSVEVSGKPLDREKKFLCASNDFIVNEQAQKYLGYVPASRRTAAKTVHAAIVEAFTRGPVELPDRGRMWEERDREPKAEPEPEPAGAGKGGGAKGEDEEDGE